jgi:hypothetical protein
MPDLDVTQRGCRDRFLVFAPKREDQKFGLLVHQTATGPTI